MSCSSPDVTAGPTPESVQGLLSGDSDSREGSCAKIAHRDQRGQQEKIERKKERKRSERMTRVRTTGSRPPNRFQVEPDVPSLSASDRTVACDPEADIAPSACLSSALSLSGFSSFCARESTSGESVLRPSPNHVCALKWSWSRCGVARGITGMIKGAGPDVFGACGSGEGVGGLTALVFGAASLAGV